MLKTPKILIQQLRGELRSQIGEKVCPYCFDNFKLNTTPFRCRNLATLWDGTPMCPPRLDPVLEKVWKDRRPVGRVLTPPPGRFATQMLCPDCHQRSTDRLCPHCHQTLPHTFAEHRNYVFAVIGAKGAGKSNYIPALIEHIKNNLGPRMGMLLRPTNDFTMQHYKNDFYDPLFRNHKVVVATQSALADTTIRLPMVFTLTISGHGWLGGERAVTISFFDTAGEDLKAEKTIYTINKYIYRSDGIILLVDPLQLDPVRDKLGTSVQLPPQDTGTSNIVARVSKLIRDSLGLNASDRIPIPLAVVLSKLDAVQPLLDPQMQVNADPLIGNGIDLDDFQATDAELRSLLSHWGSEHLVQQVSTDFKSCGFFGVSALGCQPGETGEVPYVVPKRVTDPFLWLLYCKGLVKRMN